MPTYKLYYFPSRGLGEGARLIFKHAGVEFDDIRISGKEWAVFKPKTPYGTMPVLEVDGKLLAGSFSIQRYLAEEFGLAGSNAWENAQLDSILDVGKDLLLEMAKLYEEKDEAKRAEMMKFLKEKSIPKYMQIFEKLIMNNRASECWLFGANVTYVDLLFFNVVQFVELFTPNALDDYPNVQKNKVAVETLPNIAKWLKERPKTDH